MKYIKNIQVVRGIGETPARVSRKSGLLQLNADKWDDIKDQHKPFICLHEEGHVALNTSHEPSADAYAFNQFLAKGGNRKDAVQALTDNLKDSNPGHRQRAFLLLQRALMHQYKTTGDKKALEQFLLNNNSVMNTARSYSNNAAPVISMLSGSSYENNFDEIFGLGKNAKAKKAIRLDKKKAKVENIKSKAESRVILAQQGIKQGGGFLDAIKGVASIVTGKPMDEPVQTPPIVDMPPPQYQQPQYAQPAPSPVANMLTPGSGVGDSMARPSSYEQTPDIYPNGGGAGNAAPKEKEQQQHDHYCNCCGGGSGIVCIV